MTYVGENPNFNKVLLDDKSGGGVDNAPATKSRLLNRNGGLVSQDDTGSEEELIAVVFEEGTYTPTTVGLETTPTATFPFGPCSYIRIGNSVTVWGRVSVTDYSNVGFGVAQSFSATLPIVPTNNFPNESTVGGFSRGTGSTFASIGFKWAITSLTSDKTIALFRGHLFNDPAGTPTVDSFVFNYRLPEIID